MPWQAFCTEIKLAETAHHARLTVNSEEILACLVESLDSGRPEGTRAELFNAVAAMARSCAIHGHAPTTSGRLPTGTGSATELSESQAGGLSATLRKGLPAIAYAVSAVLDCPLRRAFAWKERKAALDLIVALAVLGDLQGPEGPLGEYRLRLIQGATRGKRDSVAAVREAAVRALEALGASGATEETERRGTHKTNDVSSCLGSPLGSYGGGGGGGGTGGVRRPEIPVADTINNQRSRSGEVGVTSAHEKNRQHHPTAEVGTSSELDKSKAEKKKKTLDGALRRWERAASDAADAAERKIERFREHRDEGRKAQQRRRAEEAPAEALLEEASVVSRTPSALSPKEERPPPSGGDGEQQERRPTSPSKPSPSVPTDGREDGKIDVRDRRKSTPLLGTPRSPENGAEAGAGSTNDVDRAPPEREQGAKTSQSGTTTALATEPETRHEEGDIPPARRDGARVAEVQQQDSVREVSPLTDQRPLPTDQRPLPTTTPSSSVAQNVHVSVTSMVPKLDQEHPVAPVVGAVGAASAAVGAGEGPASMLAPSSLLPPMNGGIQADTARLLQHLCNKTDTIASVLESLGQRVVGMERTLVVSPTFSSLSRGIG